MISKIRLSQFSVWAGKARPSGASCGGVIRISHLSLFSESAIDDEFIQQLDPAIDELHIGPLEVASSAAIMMSWFVLPGSASTVMN